MDVQIRYRGNGLGQKNFDKDNLNSILPQALSQSFGEVNKFLFELPMQYDVKSYKPYTCKEIRKFCIPLYTEYEKMLGQKSFSRPLIHQGASRFLSSNEEFQITTFPKNELPLWIDVAQRQQMYFSGAHNTSYLPRTYGLYSYKQHKKEKVYFSVTNNVLPNKLLIQENYSLKGCQIRSKKPSGMLSDVDFKTKYKDRLVITQQQFNHIYAILKRDCEFLCANNWVNYYLFIAIHEVSQEPTQDQFKVSNDTVSEHTLQQEDFGLIGKRSLGILAKHTETPAEIQTQRQRPHRDLLLYIGIMGNLRQYKTLRKIGASICGFFNIDNSWKSPEEYKDRFLAQFRQQWFTYEVNQETRI